MTNSLAHYRLYIATLFLLGILFAGTVFILHRPAPNPLMIITTTPRPTATAALIIVDVRGAVNKPGVYTLTVASRVKDAIAIAGDVLSNADMRTLNLARRLNDGEQIYVPALGEATLFPTTSSGTTGHSPTPTRTPFGRINVNTAAVSELDALPGIGPTIGQRIVDYRTQNGYFKKIEDIKKVRGVGDAVFVQIKDFITVQ